MDIRKVKKLIELLEETGLVVRGLKLIGVYSDPGRDPRRHTVSIAYLVTVEAGTPAAGDDAASAAFVRDWQQAPMAFDHARIVGDAVRLKDSSGARTSGATTRIND
jgi:8-oxo-dGTP diphosphatase